MSFDVESSCDISWPIGVIWGHSLAGGPPASSAPRTDKTAGHGAVSCGQGRGRTADLPIFSRTLVPTELPGRCPRNPAEPAQT